MRVLISAFACRPGAGSEPGAGWTFSEAAARAGHQVTLITSRHNEPAITAALATPAPLAIDPVYLGMPSRVHARWDRWGRPGRHLHYLAWQGLAGRRARALQRADPFDVAHHVTLTADWMPSSLAWVDELAVVWGPIGGAERVPPSCRPWLGWRGRLEEGARRMLADPMRWVFGRRTARRVALIIAQNDEAAAALGQVAAPVIVRTNVFLDNRDFPVPSPDAGGRREEPSALFVGRLLAWKGVHLALAVLAHPDLARWHLDVIGSGPESGRLARSAARLGLSQRVHFHGQRSRDEVVCAMQAASVLLYPSMRDAASWVVGEAQMVGLPVVCLDTGGPSALVAVGGGVAVTPSGPVVDKLAQAVAVAVDLPRRRVAWSTDDLPQLLTEWYTAATRPAAGIEHHSIP